MTLEDEAEFLREVVSYRGGRKRHGAVKIFFEDDLIWYMNWLDNYLSDNVTDTLVHEW